MSPSEPSKKTQNSGYLYPNEKKNDNQPDRRGKLTIDGKEWWLSAWEKKDKNGVSFWSLAVTDPANQPKSLQSKGGNPSPGVDASSSKQDLSQKDLSLAPASPLSAAPPIHSVDDTFGDIFKDM